MPKDAKGHGSESKGRTSVWDSMTPKQRADMRLKDASRRPQNTYQVAQAIAKRERPRPTLRSAVKATPKKR